MKLIPLSFHPEGPCIEFVGTFDLHIGSPQFQEKKALAHRSYILGSPDRYTFDGGDSQENAIRDSPGSAVFEQIAPPRVQRDMAREFYRPLKPQMLGVFASNHGDRSNKSVDWSPDEWLADVMDVPYIKWEAVFSITVSDPHKAGMAKQGYTYLIHVRHSVCNGTTPASIIQGMMRKSQRLQGCDAYLTGHCHQWVWHPLTVTVCDPRHKKLKQITQHLVASSAFLSYEDGYAEQKGYAYPTEGQVSLKLYRDERKVEVGRLVY